MCTANCNPACNFTWTYPNGANHFIPSLYIYPLQKNHDGKNKCKGFNYVGYKDNIIVIRLNIIDCSCLIDP